MVDTRAIAHFKRTGVILPGHADEVAEWIARNNGKRAATVQDTR